MHVLRMGLALGVVMAVQLAPLVLAQPCLGQIRVNEILADPGRDYDGDGTLDFKLDEWVEIVNAGPTAVQMDNYRLSDGGTRMFRFGFAGSLPAGAVQLVTGGASVEWEAASGLSTAGLSLNNSGDTVRLWRVEGADTLLVDSYAYASFEVLDDRSVGRVPDGGPTWALFDGRNPYNGTTPPLGTGCDPTPGAPNACPTAVEPSTWSDVKRLFATRRGDAPLQP